MAEASVGTVVTDLGRGRGDCGYCKQKESNVTHSIYAHVMSVDEYEGAHSPSGAQTHQPLCTLLCRGWRRCGNLVYLPINASCCCPQYAIRLEASRFAPSKAQRRVLSRFQRFLDGSFHPLVPSSSPSCTRTSRQNPPHRTSDRTEAIRAALSSCANAFAAQAHLSQHPPGVSIVSPSQKALRRKALRPHTVLSSPLPLALSASLAKVLSPADAPSAAVLSKQLVSQLQEHAMLPRPVEAYASDGYINFTDSSEQADVKSSVAKEAMNSTGSRSDESDKQPPEKERLKRNFQMTISENEFTEEKFELWRKYQHAVHGDAWNSLTKRSFTNFLVDTPMCSQHARSETGTVGLGSFHQHYRVDGKLIAVGVLDFLPNYLSSKYFFFDPDYRKLALGTYSAIQEARLAFCEGIKYYCMGYFVANSKMRYKAQFSPSEILCPRSLTWIDFQECADQLEACSPALRLHLPSQFEELALKLDEAMKALWLLVPSAGLIRLEELEHILVNGTEESVDKILQQLRESLSEFVRLVGQECIKRVAYLLPERITQMLVPQK